MSKEWKFSVIFRKYSFAGTLVMMSLEGEIEGSTFFITEELLNLVSRGFQHNLLNLFFVYFYFIILMVAAAIFMLFKSHYKSMSKYFLETKSNLRGVYSSMIDRGIICVLLGFVHRILLDSPNEQLVALLLIEVGWICSRVYFLRTDAYNLKLLSVEFLPV